MRWSRLETPVAMGVLVGAIGAACVVVGDEPRLRGDLTVAYDFQGLHCAEAGVDSITLELQGDRGDTASADAACEPSYFTFVDLLEDDYDVVAHGYDSSYGLLYRGAFRATVYGNSGSEVRVSLPLASGGLSLYWTFEGSAACLDVVDVHVLLRDPFGALYDDSDYPCDQAGVAYGDVMSGSWDVWLDGLDYANGVLYHADNVSVYVDADVDNVYDIDLSY